MSETLHRDIQKYEAKFRLKILPLQKNNVYIYKIKLRAILPFTIVASTRLICFVTRRAAVYFATTGSKFRAKENEATGNSFNRIISGKFGSLRQYYEKDKVLQAHRFAQNNFETDFETCGVVRAPFNGKTE